MKRSSRAVRAMILLGALALLALVRPARAQGPAVDPAGPPGRVESRGGLGVPLGSAGISAFDTTPGAMGQPIGGRAGPSVSRAPVGGLQPPTTGREPEQPERFRLRALEPADVPQYGELELPADAPDQTGPPDGLTLDAAIDRLVERNLALLALKHEIDQARADVLTASLRVNPVLYADTQFIPYGRFSNERPGGQTQYDVNVTLPVDVTGKRKARTAAARQASRVTEAQFQDAVRLQIDNLYTAYVDVVAAEETLRFSRAYADGIRKLLELNLDLLEQGQITEATTDALRAQVEQAQYQVREATQAVGRTSRALAVLLDVPRVEVDALRVRAPRRQVSDLPMPIDAIVAEAVACRPDLVAYRLGVGRADADLRLAHAERYSDVYVLAQPYTFQDNSPFGSKSATSWAVGVTVPLPLYNRNQGNIARAQSNAVQTRIEVASIERQVAAEAEEAARELELSRDGVFELEQQILPSSRRVRDAAFARFRGGEANALEYLEAQRQYNDVVRQYRDSLVRHRRAMLDLNTAVGARILP
ncbi:TolC family protein [Paludisphaera soli]|uniref:TolC family protein n=1 Tax=Paludisphaera soli TaxID=2712865 RepID=UPI00197DFFB4|nr:TolC family protein [Paludisphaera soli]